MERKVAYRQAPVVVVGSGAAGLACALALAPTPAVILTKTAILEGGSSVLAQGGIAAALGPKDSPDQHATDTLAAGHGLSDPDRVNDMVRDGPSVIRELIAAGLPVDRRADGGLSLGREAAHSRHRIVQAGGDAIGRDLVATLLTLAAKAPSVEFLTATAAIDLIVKEGRIAGLLACREGDGWIVLDTPNVVLATGGIGALWQETTNPAEATGDGLALAARAGAELADLEFMQFHPTALVPRNNAGGDAARARLPLLTEALRGAGARLVDMRDDAFMQDEHPLGDLAPRDVVARAIWRRRSAGDPVFLDLRPALAGHGRHAFPQAIGLCREAGFDPTATPVPVTPAAHYHMGGVSTDAFGRTSIPGLRACGEVAATGVHGANRLASNSLLEALVFARRVAETILPGAVQPNRTASRGRFRPPALAPLHDDDLRKWKEQVRAVMSRHVGISRGGPGLCEATASLEHLQEAFDAQPGTGGEADSGQIRAWSEARNMLLAGRLVAHAALRRAESRGAHFRSDFPQPREGWKHRQMLTIADLEPIRAGAHGYGG